MKHRGVNIIKSNLLSLLAVAIILCGCQPAVDSVSSIPAELSPPTSAGAPAYSPETEGYDPEDNAESGNEARIIVTRDFHEVILDEFAGITGDISAMEALMKVAEVETAYGGGFVNGINGLRSGRSGGHTSKEDWFLFFNGIMSNTGALDYTLNPGDIEHWDYHNWDFRQFIPAIIGDFPEPFLHGYGGQVYPTVVTYQDGREEGAQKIADMLAGLGVRDITCVSLDELSAHDRETGNLILLGDREFEPIKELNEPWHRLGFYCQFEGDLLRVFDSVGDLVSEHDGDTGLLQATQSIWNTKGIGACENVIWMVTGVDDAGVNAAVDTLIENSSEFKHACAVVIAGGEIIRVP